MVVLRLATAARGRTAKHEALIAMGEHPVFSKFECRILVGTSYKCCNSIIFYGIHRPKTNIQSGHMGGVDQETISRTFLWLKLGVPKILRT